MKHFKFKTAIPFLKYIFAKLPTGTYQFNNCKQLKINST